MSSDHPNKGHTPPAKKDDHTTTTTTTNKNDEEQPSLLSRIQNSASNLIQDSLAKPSGTALSSDLAHVLDSGNKASSFPASSSAASTWAAGSGRSSNALGNGGSSLNAHDEYTSRMDGGFRSAQSDRARALDVSEFDAFQSTGGFFQGDQDELFQENSSKGKGKEKSSEQRVPNAYGYIQDYEQDMTIDINDEYESSYFSAYEMAWINASRLGTVYRSTTSTPSKRLSQTSQSGNRPSTAHSQIRHENENDGAEVVTLLTDPSFQPGLGAWDDETAAGALNTTYGSGSGSGLGFDLDLADDPLDIEGFPRALAQSLSPAEMQVLDLFRKHHAQYPHQTTQEQSGEKRITAYSLIPDIDSFLAQNDNNSARNSMTDGALRNEVISNLIGAEEWLNVDERYNDEVWGYLRPAVEAAAAEIKEKEQNPAREGNDGDGPAVKRLKMILRHMARL